MTVRVGRSVDIHQHHIVEFEPFDLFDLGHLDTGGKAEVLGLDPAKARNIASLQAFVVGGTDGSGRGENRDRGHRFGEGQVVQGVGEKAHAGAAIRKAKEFDGRAFLRRFG